MRFLKVPHRPKTIYITFTHVELFLEYNVIVLGNHPLRSGRNPIVEAHQPLRSHPNHNHILEDFHQKQRAPVSHEERAEKVNSDLEKMIQFMTVLGQVDRYLSSRAKSIVSTLGRAMENIPDDDHQAYISDRESFDY